MRGSMKSTAGLAALLLVTASAGAAEAGCTRQVINRTAHIVTVSQDGGPGFTVPPHRAQAIRYVRPGQVDIAVFCRNPLGDARPAREAPAFQASYGTMAVLDRCYVEVGRGGTQPVALNNPRQGDIVVAPYELACPTLR